MLRRLVPGLALLIAACGEQAPAPPETPETAATAAESAVADGSVPITAVGDLLGEYRVAGIDGEPLDAPIGIAVSIDGPMLSFEPTCAGFVWSIRFEAGRLVTTRFGEAYADPQVPPPPVCAVALFPEQRRLAEAFDAAERVARTPANGILFEGGGRSVLLFSQ
jgi:hypothetical protein